VITFGLLSQRSNRCRVGAKDGPLGLATYVNDWEIKIHGGSS